MPRDDSRRLNREFLEFIRKDLRIGKRRN